MERGYRRVAGPRAGTTQPIRTQPPHPSALVNQEPDIVTVLQIQGLVSTGVLMLFLNIWTTQDNTIYNFSVAGCNYLRVENRRALTVAGAAIGTALAIGGRYQWLVSYLIFLGKIIPPIGGVLIADYGFRRGRYGGRSDPSRLQPAFNWAAMAAYGAGVGAAFLPLGVAPIAIATSVLVTLLLSRWLQPVAVTARVPSET